MRDWEAFVRQHLRLPEFKPEREKRIVRELAAQFEDFYRDALARGLTEDGADQFAQRQIRDWEGFASDVRRADRPHIRPRLDQWSEKSEEVARRRGGWWLMFADLQRDVLYGLRLLRKNPGFTVVAVLTLALGIGANTAIFSVIYNILARPLPVKNQDELSILWSTNLSRGANETLVSIPDYVHWRQHNQVFEDIAALATASYNLAGVTESVRASGLRISANTIRILGVEPALGRSFLPDEERPGAGRVVILSHALWQRSFGGDANVLGRTCQLDGEAYTVIGVMPAGFWFPQRNIDLWTPLTIDPDRDNRDLRTLLVVGRLKPGVMRSQAEAELNAIARRLEQGYPATNTGWGVRVTDLLNMNPSERMAFVFLLGAVGLVLLIACANVANLLLARAAARQKEIAIRAALGAGRARLFRQSLTESLLLAVLGGVSGFLLALWSVSLLEVASQGTSPLLEEIPVDWQIFSYSLALSLVASLVFGLVPAWQSSKPDLNEMLKEAGWSSRSGTGRRLRNALVVSQVSLAFILLIVAGLLLHSLVQLRQVDPGFEPDNLLTMSIALAPTEYPKDYQVSAFYQQVLERIEALPGVRSAGAVNQLPATGSRFNPTRTIAIEGRATPSTDDRPFAAELIVTPSYFDTIGAPLLQGRALSAQDTAESLRVALISKTMARNYWPGESWVGKRFKFGGPDSDSPWIAVAGVVGDVRNDDIDAPPLPQAYLPHAQNPRHAMSVLVRTASDPLRLIDAVRTAIRAIDKSQPVFNVRTMNQILYEDLAGSHVLVGMIAVFASIALILAGVGIYGVISYSVSQRTHEMGVRMALGAQPRDIFKLVVGQGMVLTLAGVGVGLAASFTLTRFLESLLFGVSATDPATFAGVAFLLAAVALLACYLPARRATKVDPMVALRYE